MKFEKPRPEGWPLFLGMVGALAYALYRLYLES
jgi:hypothetical protein